MSSVKYAQDPLHSFALLPKEIGERLRGLLRVRTFQAGEAIFLQGDAPEAIHLIASGRVKIVRVTPEGYENILCLRGPGEYFCPVPLLDKGTQLGTAVAITDVTLFLAHQVEFCQLCNTCPALLTFVQGDCLAEVRRLLNRLEAFAFRTIRERLAIILIETARRQERIEDTISMPSVPVMLHLTQEDLAGLVGATRESVSRKLKGLEREGAITLSRGRVTIRDWYILQQAAAKKRTSKQ